MLNILILVSQIALAQTVCTPITSTEKKALTSSCGAERVTAFSDKKTKVESLTLSLQNKAIGVERYITITKPEITLSQVHSLDFTKSKKVQTEINKIKQEWKIKEIQPTVVSYEVSPTTLFQTADLKVKMEESKIANKVNRAVASDNNVSAGGVGRALNTGK